MTMLNTEYSNDLLSGTRYGEDLVQAAAEIIEKEEERHQFVSPEKATLQRECLGQSVPGGSNISLKDLN